MFDDNIEDMNTINNALDQAKSSLQNLGSSSILKHLSMEPVDILPLGNFSKAQQQASFHEPEKDGESTLE